MYNTSNAFQCEMPGNFYIYIFFHSCYLSKDCLQWSMNYSNGPLLAGEVCNEDIVNQIKKYLTEIEDLK